MTDSPTISTAEAIECLDDIRARLMLGPRLAAARDECQALEMAAANLRAWGGMIRGGQLESGEIATAFSTALANEMAVFFDRYQTADMMGNADQMQEAAAAFVRGVKSLRAARIKLAALLAEAQS